MSCKFFRPRRLLGIRARERRVCEATCFVYSLRRSSPPLATAAAEEFPSLAGFRFWEGNVFRCCILNRRLGMHCVRSARVPWRRVISCQTVSRDRPRPSPARSSFSPATRLLHTVTHLFTFHKGGKIAAFLPMPSRARYVVAIAIVCLPGCLSSPPPPRRRRIPEQSRAKVNR